ncbi:carbamoyl-phosphate synthase L chain, ATP binding domain-containing protein [Suillus fuscotomentosus]|uniref:Carbamoyl-phosphate synthase L chain, ATP binding domain-containing protein n=1 Tax=Suillus fuscotomentosus TaxID=1912939 RepID=A0AAD4EC80_9AGAM|nr:carbamoyl-phosphate synthase L chain, ATP binding domain-containing protein [Suillus fuscotomentosus]KAG1903472.1 carbamoyl-phosphate synthase L chain, ATP binding domain-containing protein [Suillus fuscotomentosus]
MSLNSEYTSHKLLVANRGEIAVRIIRTAQRLGIATVAIYTSSDALSPHVAIADEAAHLQNYAGDQQQLASESKLYLSSATIISICKQHRVTMVHPGYGFLSENEEFALSVEAAQMIWLGPQPDVIRIMGLKHEARHLAANAGLQLVPGSQGLVNTLDEALNIANTIGFPVILKATAGGGGMGLIVCQNGSDLSKYFIGAQERATSMFRNGGVFIERYYPAARHIEIQVFGNGLGDVVHMGERECSVQRRHQKVVEETPSPFVTGHSGLREDMCNAAVKLCRAIKYASAGTVEFLVDDESGEFFFLEMNTRIQVEHAITEAIHPGLDLIEMMVAQGIAQQSEARGLDHANQSMMQAIYDKNLAESRIHAIEARVYCENPSEGFKPSPGILQLVEFPKEIWLRVDSWVSTGTEVTQFFDPLLCKLIVTGSTREQAVSRMVQVLKACKVFGPPNNLAYLASICNSTVFKKGKATTRFLDNFDFSPSAFTVLSAGIEMTIQDLPGRRIGLGIPRSGPMDSQAFSAANILAGNTPETEALEIVSATVKINGKEVPMWARLAVSENGILDIAVLPGPGFRIYLAIRGGFPEVPQYLGSKSTSMGLGGYQGRSLRVGDQLSFGSQSSSEQDEIDPIAFLLPKSLIPVYPQDWVIKVLAGPYDDALILTPEGNAKFYSTKWFISSSSNRMGIRLESDQSLDWARHTGGEGGSHPSNILDNGYALGTVNVNGDTPVILTNEGPDMGGYVCLCTVATGERWKLGQLSPGSTVTFRKISWQDAQACMKDSLRWIETVQAVIAGSQPHAGFIDGALEGEGRELSGILLYQAGDSAILVEYGEMRLDFVLRVRVHALESEVRKRNIKGIWSFAPCIRSTLCHYDPSVISQADVLAVLLNTERSLPDSALDLQFFGRKITFPIVLDDQWCRDALQRYMRTTRNSAVYLPSNIDYLARNNGLEGGVDEALQKLMDSAWLVFGVGFYLACPFLVPIDPRCRLVGQKMNPSRTYTPSGAVGIAGPVAAIYPVISPGGYQLFGRTLPAWQTWGKGPDFASDRPWLLQPFDQVFFEPVSEERYLEIEQEFNAGQYKFKIEPAVFSMAAYITFTDSIQQEIAEFKRKQAEGTAREEARETELLREWQAQKAVKAPPTVLVDDTGMVVGTSVTSSISASIWKIKCQPEDVIQSADDILVILEAMKTEINILAGEENVGKVVKSLGKGIREGASVQVGDILAWFE